MVFGLWNYYVGPLQMFAPGFFCKDKVAGGEDPELVGYVRTWSSTFSVESVEIGHGPKGERKQAAALHGFT